LQQPRFTGANPRPGIENHTDPHPCHDALWHALRRFSRFAD